MELPRPILETPAETASVPVSAVIQERSAAEWRRQPDVGIIRRAQAGDEHAFAVLVRAHEKQVFNLVLRLLRDRSLAEEITQEVFLRVFQGLPGFAFRCKFTTWLFQVAKNLALDELKARDRRPHRLVALDDVPPLQVVDARFEGGEQTAAMWQAIERLPINLRTTLLLRDLAGLTYSEIAETLEINLTTVKWRIFEARNRVALALARAGFASSDAEAEATPPPGAEAIRGTRSTDPCRQRRRDASGDLVS